MQTFIRYLAIAFLIAMFAYLMQACTAQQPVTAEVCTSHADVSQMQAAGCAQAAYVVDCSEPVANPGSVGQCEPPATGELGIKREVAGKSATWCCQ